MDYTILRLDFDKSKVWMVYFFTLPMRGCIGACSDGISLSLVTCRGSDWYADLQNFATPDMLDEFMRLEWVVAQMKRENEKEHVLQCLG